MPRLSLWDKRKRNDYKFFDRVISEQFYVGGTSVFIHKYVGPTDQGDTGDATQPSGETNEQTIQDLLFLENRDRRYDENVYEMRGIYTVTDADFDLRQFGLFLQNDTLYISFHYNDMIDIMGRKLMSGDVIELPHLRDDALLDGESDGLSDRPAINKYYKVTDASRSSEGFSPTWYYHIWRIKVSPLTDSQEYNDILGREVNEDGTLGDLLGQGEDGQTLRDIISNYQDEIGISDAIREQAAREVPERNFETAHFYVVPGDEFGQQYPWIFAGDGEPPNGAVPLGAGEDFPDGAKDGEYWLRTDFEPNVLYQKEGKCWKRVEVDYRKRWTAAHRILETFINNDTETELPTGRTFEEKTAISKAVKPRADFK
jgi:hypothetical protein